MKKISLKNLILMAFCFFVANGLSAQVILDYETGFTTFGFGSFGGATYVGASPNPDASGINTSSTVGEYFEAFNPPDPQCWAGIVGSPPATNRVDFVNYSNICIKVWADAPGNLLLKLEQADMGGNWEQLQPIPVGGEWVEVCFDGSQPDAASGGASAHGRTFGAVVLFFDFCSALPAPTADNTWYFDDLRMDGPAPPSMNTYDVTFAVNMNGYAGVWNDVFVSGTFNGWSGNANQLTDPDGDGIYTTTVTLPAGQIIYKFQLNQWWKQEYFAPGSSCAIDNAGNWDRAFNVTDNVVLPAYCYSSCTECNTPGSEPIVNVTFSVNMNTHPDPFTTPFFAGSYNWWSQFENPLSDVDGDNIWETTLQFVEGQASLYKFQLDGWAQQEFFTLGDPCTVNNFGNADRFYQAGAADEVLPTYCYSTCDICPATVVPTMGEWAVFILALLMVAVGAVFMMGMENKKVLATSSGSAAVGGTMKSMPFDKGNYFKAIKHALGLAVVGFAGIYLGWGEIVSADFVGMFISMPIVAYIIHLFYKK